MGIYFLYPYFAVLLTYWSSTNLSIYWHKERMKEVHRNAEEIIPLAEIVKKTGMWMSPYFTSTRQSHMSLKDFMMSSNSDFIVSKFLPLGAVAVSIRIRFGDF